MPDFDLSFVDVRLSHGLPSIPAMDRDRLMIEYDAAVHAEREAWLKVRGKHLGTELHDASLWREWVLAAERMQQLSSKLKELHANQ